MSTVICVENLGKKYTLRHQQRESYTALRDVIANGVKSLGSKILSPFTIHSSPFTDAKEDFWALKNVSFEVKQGDRIGIIGRNGAGKSTLLKILSRITEPTTGSIRIKGRVASLLEVGTGFHPELTGRENIFLNGAILGMSRAELRKKFDAIVDFAEVEKFLDTPVKRYSSGMYVRLAFAVAAHLEPEILVVDEVLAVGDAQFQKKCLGKMGELSAQDGRTVIFVSHNMGAVVSLCSRSLLLNRGHIVSNGPSEAVVREYFEATSSPHFEETGIRNEKVGISLRKFCWYGNPEVPDNFLISGKACTFKFRLSSNRSHSSVVATVGFNSYIDNKRLFICYSPLTNADLRIEPGDSTIECKLESLPLMPGSYSVTIKLMVGNEVVFYRPAFSTLTVVEGDFFGTGRLPDPSWGGEMLVPQEWASLSN